MSDIFCDSAGIFLGQILRLKSNRHAFVDKIESILESFSTNQDTYNCSSKKRRIFGWHWNRFLSKNSQRRRFKFVFL